MSESDCAYMSVFIYISCAWALFVCFPLAGPLPFNHNASRSAPSRNHLQTVELRNRERATDVSLGFLHSNWITQAGAHRQQGCTAWLLEGHSKNSFQYVKKKTLYPMESMHLNVHAGKWTHRNMHQFMDTGADQSTLNTVKHTNMHHWLMHIAYSCAQMKHLMSC